MKLIVDSREKCPASLSFYGVESEVKKLNEGDYTTQEILDLEDKTGRKILRIERKASTGELAITLGKNRKRFFNELERLKFYEHVYLILEFSIEDIYSFPENSGIPKKLWNQIRMNIPFMIKTLETIEKEYGVEIIYAENNSAEIIHNILVKAHECLNL